MALEDLSPTQRSNVRAGGNSRRRPPRKPRQTDREEFINNYRREQEGEDAASGSTLEDEFGDEFFWQDAVIEKIQDDIAAMAKAYDMDLDYLAGWFSGQQTNLLKYLESNISGKNAPTGNDFAYYTRTPQGINAIFNMARQWVGLRIPGFDDAMFTKGGGSGSGSRGGSGGSRRPTAAEIRAQFDIDQLTNAVNQMSRALVLAESSEARAIATSYVNAIVKNPEQELDFETFARKRVLGSARAKQIYRNKPDSLSEEQFLQPYVQAFMSMAGPGFGDQLAQTAAAGAQLNASPDAFQGRMERSRQVQLSTPFLSNMAEQISQIKGVLR